MESSHESSFFGCKHENECSFSDEESVGDPGERLERLMKLNHFYLNLPSDTKNLIQEDEALYIKNKEINGQIRRNLQLPPEERTDEILELLVKQLKNLNFFKSK